MDANYTLRRFGFKNAEEVRDVVHKLTGKRPGYYVQKDGPDALGVWEK
jgi:hypothetical protein